MLRAAKAALALSLVAALCLLVDWREAAGALGHADPVLAAAALAVSALGVVVSAAKWRLLLRHAGVGLRLRHAARLYWIGMFFSNFLPTGVGGDAVRLALTPAAPGRRERVAGSILVERLTGLLVMLALCALGIALQDVRAGAVGLAWLLPTALLALAFGAAALLLAPAPLARLLARAVARLPRLARRPARVVARVAAAVARHARDPEALVTALLLSLPFYGTVILAQWLSLRAVGADVTLAEAALVAPLVQLVGLLPMTPGGLGVVEAGFVLLYAGVGVAPAPALAGAVLRRVVDLANSAFGGVLWLAGPGRAATAAPSRPARAPGLGQPAPRPG